MGGGKGHFYNYLVHIIVKDGDRGISPSGGSSTIITSDDELRGTLISSIINRLEIARVSISGCQSLNLVSYDGEFNLTDTKVVETLRYEALE